MRVRSLVPIQEAFQIDLIADLQLLDRLVDIRVCTGQIRLDREAVCLAVHGYFEIQVIAFLTGSVILVEEGRTRIICLLNSHALESDFLILELNEIICPELIRDIFRFRDIIPLFDLVGRIHDPSLS